MSEVMFFRLLLPFLWSSANETTICSSAAAIIGAKHGTSTIHGCLLYEENILIHALYSPR